LEVRSASCRSRPRFPTDLFSALERITGDRYVWEHYPAGLRKGLGIGRSERNTWEAT